jgi:hypothetical protein
MTIVVYRDGMLASDSCVSDDGVPTGSFQKIIRTPRYLVGATGDAEGMILAMRWGMANFRQSAKDKALANCEATIIRINSKGVVEFWEGSAFYEVTAPFHAIGGGQHYALGALAHGATAEEAASIACQYSAVCKGPIHVLKLKE